MPVYLAGEWSSLRALWPVIAVASVAAIAGTLTFIPMILAAIGLAQVMLPTARYYRKDITREELFDRDTNLRIGFRYLRTLIEKYNGNLELALLAYNRGPERVDDLIRAGQDPNNGYVEMVLGKRNNRR